MMTDDLIPTASGAQRHRLFFLRFSEGDLATCAHLWVSCGSDNEAKTVEPSIIRNSTPRVLHILLIGELRQHFRAPHHNCRLWQGWQLLSCQA